jgi:hypothetical protein
MAALPHSIGWPPARPKLRAAGKVRRLLVMYGM